MTLKVREYAGGWHDIETDTSLGSDGGPLVLVRVRPVGTLEWGDLSMFVPEWVPELVEALEIARELSDSLRVRAGRN